MVVLGFGFPLELGVVRDWRLCLGLRFCSVGGIERVFST